MIGEASLEAVWEALARVRASSVEIHDESSEPPVIMRARGSVEVVAELSGAFVFHETGAWTDAGPAGGVRYSDVLRWSLDRDGRALNVEHLRHSASSPVPLVALVPKGDHFESRMPHECGADSYTARLTVGPSRLVLEWTVRGARKRYTAVREYTSTASLIASISLSRYFSF